MASLIRGIRVTLYEKTVEGADDFGAPIYGETPVAVDNVLISSAGGEDLTGGDRIGGNREVYELSIPKGNTNHWENSTVEFWGKKWKTFGPVTCYMENLVPLNWNKKVKVERYG